MEIIMGNLHFFLQNLQWNSTFLAFSLIIEGNTEKVLQFVMPLKSIYNKNLSFVEQKTHIFEHYRGVQWIKNLIIDIILVMKFFTVTFS